MDAQVTEVTPVKTVHVYRRDVAQAFVRKMPSGTVFFVNTRVHLPIEESKGDCFPNYATVKLSRSAALRFIRDALTEVLEQRGARIVINVYHGSNGRRHDYVFIG